MRKLACLLASILALGAAGQAQAGPDQPRPRRVAVLLFDGVEIIDYSGPYEVFGGAGYEVYTVGRSKAPVTTSMGLTVVPKYDFADAPAADIVLVPGGDISGPRKDAATLDWIRRETARDQHTLSVCNGAVILADAGLLDGLSATATYWWIPKMRASYPKIHVVDDQRWVDNGRIITAAGLSSGIDGALHLVDVMDGRGQAQAVALGIEYDWRPEGGFVRAQLADAQIPQVDIEPLGQWRMLETDGDRSRWTMRIEGASPHSAAELQATLARGLADKGHWTQAGEEGKDGGSLSHWRFADRAGQPWSGTLAVAPEPGAQGRYTIEIRVAQGA